MTNGQNFTIWVLVVTSALNTFHLFSLQDQVKELQTRLAKVEHPAHP